MDKPIKEKIEIEPRGYIKIGKAAPFIKKIGKIFQSKPKIKAAVATTIFPQIPMDLRIKFRNDRISLVYKKRKIKSTVDVKVELEKEIDLQTAKSIFKLYSLFETNEYILLDSYTLKILYPQYSLSLKLLKNAILWEIEKTETLKKYTDEKIKKVEKKLQKINKQTRKFGTEKPPIDNSIIHKIPPYDEIRFRELINSLAKKHRIFSYLKIPLEEKLRIIDNDYSFIEVFYEILTGVSFLGKENITQPVFDFIHDTFSIVVPFFNSHTTLQYLLQSLYMQKGIEWEKGEIIIVDDASKKHSHEIAYEEIKRWKEKLPILFIRNHTNQGSAITRNIGARLASGDILFFIDSDIVLSETYIWNHLLLHSLHPKLITFSLKKGIEETSPILTMFIHKNSLETPYDWTDFRYSIIKSTNYLKQFGNHATYHYKGSDITLAHMVVTHNIVLRKKEFEAVGGFHEEFKGWGLEDTFLGARLIEKGNYVVPVLNSFVYHINHPPRRKNKDKEFKKNLSLYKKLIKNIY